MIWKDSKHPLIKIIDYGIVNKNGNNISANFKAPEQLRNEHVDDKYGKCDVWSCGIILYTLLFGDPPF